MGGSPELRVCSGSLMVYSVAMVAFVAGLASPEWYEDCSNGAVQHTGVFWTCVEIGDETDCESYTLSEREDWWKSSAALLLAAGCLALISGFVAVFPPLSGSLQIHAGFLGIIGCVHFNANMGGDKMWGFYLAVLAATVFFINGVVLAVLACSYDCHMRPISCCCGQRRQKSYETAP